MVVDEIMTRNPEVIGEDRTIRDALGRMVELNIRHLPVLRDNEVVGMVSDRDLRSVTEVSTTLAEVSAGERLLDRRVVELMASDVITIESAAEVTEAIDLMIETKVGALPVVDPHSGRLVGILSYIDIMRAAQELFR